MARLSAKQRAQLPDSAFAHIDAGGRRRLPIHDAAHVRNALARFGQVAFEDEAARDRARSRLLRAAQKHGIMPVGFISAQLQPERKLPQGQLTFLLTDLEGSTELLARLGDRYATLLADVRRRVRTAVRRARGHEVSARGDDLFVVFEHAPAALDAALAIQRAMRQGGWPADTEVRLRIGLHRGRPGSHRQRLRRSVGPRRRAHLLRRPRGPDPHVLRRSQSGPGVSAGRRRPSGPSARGGSAACPSLWSCSRPKPPTCSATSRLYARPSPPADSASAAAARGQLRSTRSFWICSGGAPGSAAFGASAGASAGGWTPSDLGELAGLVHLGDDVAAADQLALDEQLRDRRPVRQRRQLLADARVGQDVDGGERRAESRPAPRRCGRRSRTRGRSGVPFMKRITSWSRIASAIASRMGFSVVSLMVTPLAFRGTARGSARRCSAPKTA